MSSFYSGHDILTGGEERNSKHCTLRRKCEEDRLHNIKCSKCLMCIIFNAVCMNRIKCYDLMLISFLSFIRPWPHNTAVLNMKG